MQTLPSFITLQEGFVCGLSLVKSISRVKTAIARDQSHVRFEGNRLPYTAVQVHTTSDKQNKWI